jgi:hypothetical protein
MLGIGPERIDFLLVALLETLDIAMHDTTNDKMGLNYNLVDRTLYRKVRVSSGDYDSLVPVKMK